MSLNDEMQEAILKAINAALISGCKVGNSLKLIDKRIKSNEKKMTRIMLKTKNRRIKKKLRKRIDNLYI